MSFEDVYHSFFSKLSDKETEVQLNIITQFQPRSTLNIVKKFIFVTRSPVARTLLIQWYRHLRKTNVTTCVSNRTIKARRLLIRRIMRVSRTNSKMRRIIDLLSN